MHSIQVKYTVLTCLFWFSTALILPIYVLLLTDLGLDLVQIALAFAASAVTIFIFEFPSGVFADWAGRKTTFIIANIILAVAMFCLFLAESFPLVLLGLFLFGTGRAFASGSLDAWFIDAIHEIEPEVDVQPYLAKSGIFILLSIALGSILGGFIAQQPIIEGINPRKLPILGDMVVKLFTAGLTMLLIEESQHISGENKKIGNLLTNLKSFLLHAKGNKKLLSILGISAILSLALNSLEVYWQPYFSEIYDLKGKEIILGLIMAGAFVLGAVGNMVSIPLSKLFKGKHQYTAALSHLFYGLAILFIGLFRLGPYPLIGFLFAYGLNGLLGSPYSTLLNNQLKPEFRSSGISASSFSGYLGGFIASIFGLVAKYYSIPTVWIISGTILILSSWIIIPVHASGTVGSQILDKETQ